MSSATSLTRPASASPLGTLIDDRNALETTIVALRYRIETGNGRDAADYQPYLDSAVARLAETEAAIARVEGRL